MAALTSPQELVRAARRSAGFTQRALAARAGTSAAAVNRYERGRAVPDLETLRRVLAACGFGLRLSMEPLHGHFDLDVAAPDQAVRDRAAVMEAVSPAEGDAWARPSTTDRTG